MDQALTDDARRSYWREQMDTAYQWMMAIRDYPVAECGEPLVSLETAVAGSKDEIRVLFSTRKHANQQNRLFYLRRGLTEPFLGVAREMNRRGWILKVEDAYRTLAMQRQLMQVPFIFDAILKKVTWECQGTSISPELMERRVTALVASMPKIGTHMSGSAVDISVFEADGRTEVDRGAPYLELSELTPMASPFISEEAARNRQLISDIWLHHGFVAYPFEFWHYSQGDAYDEYIHRTGRPARYGAVEWNPETGEFHPCKNPLTPLMSHEEIHRAIAAALHSQAGAGMMWSSNGSDQSCRTKKSFW